MKKVLLFATVVLSSFLFSCSNEYEDCLIEKKEIIERFDELIDLASDDPDQRAALIQQRDDKLRLLGC